MKTKTDTLIRLVFTDRDGVLNRNVPGEYNKSIKEFRLLPGVKEALGRLTKAGYEIHVISNQQGIPKGLMPLDDLEEMTQALRDRIAPFGGKLTSVNYCLHLETDKCGCRKPQSGLFHQAIKNQKIDFSQTWMVGDSWRDIHAGQAVGCRTIFVNNPKVPTVPGKPTTFTDGKREWTPDFVVRNFPQAVDLILHKNKFK